MEAITKERFLARLYEMRSKQANNSRAITQEDYDNIIKKLKLLDKKVQLPHQKLRILNNFIF